MGNGGSAEASSASSGTPRSYGTTTATPRSAMNTPRSVAPSAFRSSRRRGHVEPEKHGRAARPIYGVGHSAIHNLEGRYELSPNDIRRAKAERLDGRVDAARLRVTRAPAKSAGGTIVFVRSRPRDRKAPAAEKDDGSEAGAEAGASGAGGGGRGGAAGVAGAEESEGGRARTLCAVCVQRPEDPWKAPCGHVACKTCWKHYFAEVGDNHCPECAAPVEAEELQHAALCCICDCVPDNPWRSTCLHVCCRSCWTDYLAENAECPECADPVDPAKLSREKE